MVASGVAYLKSSLWVLKGLVADICHTHNYEPEPPFPISWFNDFGTFTLERQAIFGRYWLQITHSNRVRKVGDYTRIDIAGHQLVLARGVDRSLHVFHNKQRRHDGSQLLVRRCQGRGVPVREEYEWSLNIEGSIVRLPCKLNNNHSKTTVRVAHMHVDKHGFVWINLDSSSKPQVSWQDQASCIDAMEKFKGFSPSDYTYSHSWSIGGDFDWKTFVDYHFNEYCRTHADSRGCFKIMLFAKDCKTPDNMVVNFDREMLISPTYICPATMITFNDRHMCLVRCEPTGPGQADIHVEVYRHQACCSKEFLDMEDYLKETIQEDITLCNMRQHI